MIANRNNFVNFAESANPNNDVCTNQQLQCLKEYFKNEIDSKRTFNRIHTLQDLRNILIKRDCDHNLLSGILNQMGIEIGNPSDRVQPQRQPVQNGDGEIRQRLVNFPDVPAFPHVPADPIERIDQLISLEIGQKWKNLARVLSIPEGQIDQLNNLPIDEATRRVLRYHRECERMWKTSLIKGLQKARRGDLSHQVQIILEYYNLL
ncbi:uncharacterized protein [Diabrotica undecimpunctata]|uniref:uncharacterized protein n=1 Tax=Diabrotica undecimpunctata TaxID=50387 RepID=UPI003B6329CD